jgi:Nucleolar pre-ribosomal-associated protein 1
VPEFYKLFESGNLTHVRERKLILEMMRDGTQHYRDYELGRNSHAWEMIMSFYGSPLSNAALNILISEVFLAASRVPFVGRGLVKANGFFTWLTYQLVVDDNTEAVGYLIVSARNCISDLLRSKQRKCFDARRLVKPLLQSVDRGVAALTATESVLLFFSDLLLFWPSQDPVLLILTPAEVNSVIDIGVNYLRHARRNLDAEHWRHRCCRAMKTISHLRLMQEVSDSVVPVYLLQKFVSDVVGVVYSVDVD